MEKYPTLDEVQKADQVQLARWWRFLPSPGSAAIDNDPENFEAALTKEAAIMEAISLRFTELGGMTPSISKAIGWDCA